jgi:hypothetical protein
MQLRLCDHAARCNNYRCPHYHPHYEYPAPSLNGKPQCGDKDVYCYEKGWSVNCQPINRRQAFYTEDPLETAYKVREDADRYIREHVGGSDE